MPDAAFNITNRDLLKAEAVYADLIQNGATPEDITIQYSGAFKRRFRKDIDHITIDADNKGSSFLLSVNRNGIYDLLPEGIFHQSRGANAVRTTADAVQEHKQFKTEESDARKFFVPLEEMIFRYSAMTELEDRRIRQEMHKGSFNHAQAKFWNLDNNIPGTERNRMMELMPYLSIIKCDRKATALSLQYILNMPVSLQQQWLPVVNGHETTTDVILGSNSQLGTQSGEQYPCWVFSITARAHNDLLQFVPGAGRNNVLKRFAEIFVPFYIDIKYEFEKTGQSSADPGDYVLGYAAVI